MTVVIDRPGTFRGKPLDWGVSATNKNGFPQFVLELSALEHYNEETGEYEAWGQYDMAITAYLVMFSNTTGEWKEAGSNVAQIKKVFGWDGKDFETLANGKYADTMLMFQIKPNVWEGNTRLQVSWIDTADANPTRELPKFDATKLKELTEKMGGVIPGSAAASAKPATPPKRAGRPKASTPASTPAASPAPSGATPPAAPETPPATPAPSGSVAPITTPPTPETKATAWAGCCQMRTAETSDAKLAEVWVAEVQKIGKAEDQFTPSDWSAVKDAVIQATGKF
jgi:hypothetical protein